MRQSHICLFLLVTRVGLLGALGGDVDSETKVEYVLNLTHKHFNATLKHVKKSVIAMDVKLRQQSAFGKHEDVVVNNQISQEPRAHHTP